MKDRILAELYGLAFDTDVAAGFKASLLEVLPTVDAAEVQRRALRALQAIVHDYSRLNIATIDSFFQKVLRNLARELGRGSRFNLEMNTTKVLQEAVRATIEKAAQNKQVLAWLTTFAEHKMADERSWRVESDLLDFSRCIYNEFFQENEQQLRRQLEENPSIFAELNRRQQALQAKCKQIFQQIQEKANALLDRHELFADDFGNSKYGLLYINRLGNGDTAVTAGAYVEKCRADAAFWGKSRHPRKKEIEHLAAAELIPLLEKAMATLSDYKTSRMITGNLHQLGLIWDIDRELAALNAENNRFMLSDTARFLHDMIDGSDAPFIYEKMGSEIRHVMIDEFQDTSRLQWENFHALLSNILANDDFSLIVGDVKQSIYRWRNGDWRILGQIGQRLQAQVKTLEYNYRSERRIIDFNNAFFLSAAAMLDSLHELKFGTPDGSPFPATYATEEVRQRTKKQTQAGYVSVDFIPQREDGEEARTYSERMQTAVFQQLQKLQEAGIPAAEICILTRKNSEIGRLADYLASLAADYPAMAEAHYLNIISDEAFQLKSSPAVRLMIEALRVIADPDHVIAAAALDRPRYNEEYQPLIRPKTQAWEDLRKVPLLELAGHLYRLLEPAVLEGQDAYLFAFYDYLSLYLRDQAADLPAFLQYWDDELKYRTVAAGAGVAGVRAMTIHKSKGLQFPTVLVPYCDWSLNPKPNATIVWCGPREQWYDAALLPVTYSAAMAETIFADAFREETVQSWMDNLNLLYVAFTRAERNLILLAKQKVGLKDEEQLTAVSHLLQLAVPEMDGAWDEDTLHYEAGQLTAVPPRVAPVRTGNPLKQAPPVRPISFISNALPAGRFLFKQSNRSREFVTGKPSNALYGNIMHYLFEQVTDQASIDIALDRTIAEGLLLPDEKAACRRKILDAIRESNVEHWFDGHYRTYRELSMIVEENGEIVSKRPDRVLLSDTETLVVDYKFGAPHPAHRKQVRQYMDWLAAMHYPQVKGYLWYVEDRFFEEIQ
jgi:ATP-dependent exoDNAse (exonuclease V) beta subunit